MLGQQLMARRTMRHRSRQRQRGITLLESLVSMLILVIGVLAMLGVQVRTLVETQVGVRRSQAIRLIEDFSERVKSNSGNSAQLADYASDWSAAAPTTDCLTQTCSPTQVAQFDVSAWKKAVAANLPGGSANVFVISAEAAPRRQLGIMVAWRVNERSGAGTAYKAPFLIDTAESAGTACPAEYICHLVYVQR